MFDDVKAYFGDEPFIFVSYVKDLIIFQNVLAYRLAHSQLKALMMILFKALLKALGSSMPMPSLSFAIPSTI